LSRRSPQDEAGSAPAPASDVLNRQGAKNAKTTDVDGMSAFPFPTCSPWRSPLATAPPREAASSAGRWPASAVAAVGTESTILKEMPNLRSPLAFVACLAVLAGATASHRSARGWSGDGRTARPEVIAAGGGTVYIGSGSAFRAVDVTDPQSPTVIGELVVDDRLSSIAVELNHAYLTGSVGGPLGGVRVVDISDPHSPTQVGEYVGSDPLPPRVLDAAGDLVYVVQHGDLSILDVSDPAAPALAGSWEPPSGSIRAGSVDGKWPTWRRISTRGRTTSMSSTSPTHPADREGITPVRRNCA